jgi:hypothetical protein
MSEEEKKEEWNEVVPEETKKEKVEYEVEGEQKEEAPPPKEEEVIEEPPKKEVPPELEGIETKGAQKRIRQLVKQRKERDEQIAQIIQQNEQLSQQLNQVHQQFTSARGVNLDTTEKQLSDKLELARNAYKAAHEEGDSQKVLQAQEILNDAQTDLKAVQVHKQQFQQQQPQQNQQGIGQQQPQYQPQPTPDPKAQDWASQNEWFGSDRVMTAAALAIDAELKEEGFSPTDPEFYQEVDNRIKETFPHKFSTTNEEVRQQEKTSPPAQVVAGASRSSPGSNKKVKLSKEDIRLANKWNVPLEKYAEEKLKADKAEGEYTTINMQRGG